MAAEKYVMYIKCNGFSQMRRDFICTAHIDRLRDLFYANTYLVEEIKYININGDIHMIWVRAQNTVIKPPHLIELREIDQWVPRRLKRIINRHHTDYEIYLIKYNKELTPVDISPRDSILNIFAKNDTALRSWIDNFIHDDIDSS